MISDRVEIRQQLTLKEAQSLRIILGCVIVICVV